MRAARVTGTVTGRALRRAARMHTLWPGVSLPVRFPLQASQTCPENPNNRLCVKALPTHLLWYCRKPQLSFDLFCFWKLLSGDVAMWN